MGALPQKRHTTSTDPLIELPLRKSSPSRKYFGIFAFLSAAVLLCYTQINITDFSTVLSNASTLLPLTTKLQIVKYLIHTSTCRIPDADPYNEDVKRFIHRVKQMPCSRHEIASYITINDEAVTLHINQTLLKTVLSVVCCYSNVSRVVKTNESDDAIKLSDCEDFKTAVNLSAPTVMVKCKNSFGGTVYSNVHTVIDKRFMNDKETRAKLKQNSPPLSVVFVGIDSISKMNLVRTMPKVDKFLKSHDFINLKGYTKIGDNTFPNLMAILTGKTTDQVYAHCEPAKKRMNGCDIIWDKFRNLGYATAYAEDQSSIATFNYNRMGFGEPPTTFYFRPYIVAAEQLPSLQRFGMRYCAGPITSGERIMTLAKDFIINLKDTPKFGLFWMNTFSHDDINLPSAMDGKVEAFLKDVDGHLENTILIFFSDHGFRFGDIRYTHTGYVEERLPFIYIHLPNTFKEQYAEEYNNFVVNSERLTNPFDMHMTLQDILRFNNDNYTIAPSQACPKCQSLFKEISEKRTCKDGAIDEHWCLCTGNSYIDVRKPIVQATSQYILSEVNKKVRSYEEGAKLCSYYHLKKVVSAGMSDIYLNEYNRSVNNFLIIIETRPPAMFEATVEGNFQIPQKPEFRLLGDISRLDRYKDKSACVQDHILKKYCYCDGLFTSIKSAICNFFNCV